MTIRPGEEWGCDVPRPADLRVVDSDADFVDAVEASPARPVAVRGGDLARTLGNPNIDSRSTLRQVAIDLVEVRLDDRADTVKACAHVVARSPWMRGGWWRGDLLLVMNSEFLGTWDVAPRGHPNDGRVETFAVGADFGVRERAAARHRLPTAGHVPHPAVRTGSVRAASWRFDSPRVVFVDGRCVGRASTIEVTVVPDAATLHT